MLLSLGLGRERERERPLTSSIRSAAVSLIHASISRGSTILVEHAQKGKRNFSDAAATILSKIPPNNSKLTCPYTRARSRSSSAELDDDPHPSSLVPSLLCLNAHVHDLDVWEQYLFHYVSENGVIYLVMADDSVGR